MLTNCIAKAKLVFNKKLKSYKLVVAFNAHKQFKKDKWGNKKVVYAFPTQAKCAYVSGDLLAENLQAELASVLPSVYATLRTNSVEFVE
jgi:ribosomal protein S6